MQIGIADSEDGSTGATMLLFSKPVMAAVDTRGGVPGIVNTDILRPGQGEALVDAITFAGVFFLSTDIAQLVSA